MVVRNLSSKSARQGFRYRTPIEANCATAVSVKPGVPVTKAVVLTVTVRFPSCWDGQFNDHQQDGNTADFMGGHPAGFVQHVAYPVMGACPAGFGARLPTLVFTESWDYRGNGKDVALSSGMWPAAGAGYTFHADFWNTWEPATLQYMTDQCINTGVMDESLHITHPEICGPPVINQP
ncbi:DUF1996 domain-containing protein [Nostocoides vanveenii]|uniref:DUF1996 domain-containing protein n=1 Tax=Nostocoides vanveenii TaxID=330835 RepID=UPI0031E02328